jgi:hypothetical protein
VLEEIEEVEEVVLAHPLKTRLIADAQIKTDRLDALALGTLLRGNLVARAYIPRRRDSGAKESAPPTALLGAAAHDVAQSHSCAPGPTTWVGLPQCSDIFGVLGPHGYASKHFDISSHTLG